MSQYNSEESGAEVIVASELFFERNIDNSKFLNESSVAYPAKEFILFS